MNISILTLFPELYQSFLATSLIKRASEDGKLSHELVNLFSFCQPKERVDGPVFGHGAGMVIRPEVMERAITAREASHGPAFKVFFSPHGEKLTQDVLRRLQRDMAQKQHLMLLPARYEGMDARIEAEYADAIISVGDFVLMGGDLPAMMFLEGFLRLIPGIVGKQQSVAEESFEGPFVDHPAYTAPVVWKGREVPAVLRSGDHKKIAEWQAQESVTRSVTGHFDWIRTHTTSEQQDEAILREIPPHYVVLMHTDVLLPAGQEGGTKVGTTSVTSLDIHDIARSASTYGIKGYHIVTPLEDQKRIVHKLLNFWSSNVGIVYNPHRHSALRSVSVSDSLEQVVATIEKTHGQKPLIVATSAQMVHSEKSITYHDQAQVWAQRRPVILLLGTGRGLSAECVAQADFVLVPLRGYTSFNHLSVRSAAAVIFDRWLGVHPISATE